MILLSLFIIVGLLLLIKGADWLVEGGSALAKRFKVSDLAIGLTVVSFGTSAPELVVNAFSSFQGNDELVFGNIIGSNNFNLFIILGIAGLVYPLVVQSSTVWREIPISFLAVVFLYILAGNLIVIPGTNLLSRGDGLLLLILFALFLFYVFRQLKADAATAAPTDGELPLYKAWIFIFAGLAGLILGGQLVVDNAVLMATELGVSQKMIGLTIVAAGTSLPELMTSVIAAIKKNNDIAVGNIIGSNIFNIFLILGVSSLIKPLAYNRIFNTDLYILAGGTFLLFAAMFTGRKKKLDRWEAAVLLIFYLGYTLYLISLEA